MLIWNLAWIIMILSWPTLIQLKAATIMTIISAFLYIYLSFLLYPIFAKQEKIFSSIKDTLIFATAKFYYYLPNFILITLLIPLILMQLIGLISMLNQLIAGIIILLMIPVYLTWMKFYMFNLIQKQ